MARNFKSKLHLGCVIGDSKNPAIKGLFEDIKEVDYEVLDPDTHKSHAPDVLDSVL